MDVGLGVGFGAEVGFALEVGLDDDGGFDDGPLEGTGFGFGGAGSGFEPFEGGLFPEIGLSEGLGP